MTPKQAECLAAIERLTTPEGVSPSYEQIAAELGLASKGAVHARIEGLLAHGYLVRPAGRYRGLRVAHKPSPTPYSVAALDRLTTGQLMLVQDCVADLLTSRRAQALRKS